MKAQPILIIQTKTPPYNAKVYYGNVIVKSDVPQPKDTSKVRGWQA